MINKILRNFWPSYLMDCMRS